MIDIPPRKRPLGSVLALIAVILLFESGCGTSHEAEPKYGNFAGGPAEAQARSDAPRAELAMAHSLTRTTKPRAARWLK